MTDVLDAESSDTAPDPSFDPSIDDQATASEPTFLQRAGARIIRRPSRWLNAPWPIERVVQYLTALIVVGGCTFAVIQVIHLDLVFTNNTPTGGDMGAHVAAPAYLRDHLLNHFQLTGWTNYWYNGFPLYRFYMVIPALMIVLLNVVFPYGVAFKIVACIGLVSLPFCCWAFGRLAKFVYPIPELMALAGLIFLFDESFSIYGGNVKSTMAGEFSFSIALSFAILGLGLFAAGLRTGKYRSWTAIVLALAMLSHGIVLIFVVLGALLMWLIWLDKTRFFYGVTMGITAVLLSAFWVVPFLANHQYMTDMKYGYRPDGANDSFWVMFFPWTTFLDIVVSGFALIGFATSVVKRNLTGAWLGIMCFALMAATYLARSSLPVIGLLWNPRILPFLYLVRLLLMMVGIVDTVHFIVKGMSGVRTLSVKQLWVSGVAIASVVGLVVLTMELFLFREMPGARMTTKNGKSVYAWGIGGWDPITLSPNSTDALADGWTRYNFRGYEGREYYGEYKALIDTMAALGNDPAYGCGQALWENNGDTGPYGTTMALMLLPHWTDGCITSSEGLYFEASGTTPYHFLSAAAMSKHSSNPVRELRYVDNDASVGVPMMQKMGDKYLMVFTADAKKQADGNSDLQLVRTSGPWKIYTVKNSPVVEPLTVQPVVANARPGDQRERHLELGTSWFQNTSEWAAMPADSGPKEWQRIDVKVDASRSVGTAPLAPGRKVDIVVPVQKIVPKALPAITVSNARMGTQDFSFDVSQVGVPVLVKISYFPNWKVDGADGPYRVAPNFMVVIPRSTHVRLHYDMSSLDKVAYLLTLIGIALLCFWRYKGDVVHRSEHPFLVLAADGQPLDGDALDGDVLGDGAFGDDPFDDDVGGGRRDDGVIGDPGVVGDPTPVGVDVSRSMFGAPDASAAVAGPPVDGAPEQVEGLLREQPDGPADSV